MSLIRVTCYCKICNQHVCSYNNKWIKINDIYSTYEHPMSYLQTGLTSAGEPIERTEESGLAGLHTVAMACTVCGTPLGIKCVKAPERKIKYKNRVFLELAKLRLLSLATDEEVEAFYEQQEPPVENSTADNLSKANEIVSWEAKTLNEQYNNAKISLENSSIGDTAKVSEPITKEAESLYEQHDSSHIPIENSSIGDLPKAGEELSKLSSSPKAFSNTNDEVIVSSGIAQLLAEQRKDIDGIRKTMEQGVNEVREDISSIRELIKETTASFKPPGGGSNTKYASEEDLDLLADTVSSVQERITGYESNRLKLRILEQRIQSLEQSNAPTQSSRAFPSWTQSNPQSPQLARFNNAVPRRARPREVMSPLNRNFNAQIPPDSATNPERSQDLPQDRGSNADNDIEMTTEPTKKIEVEKKRKKRDPESRSKRPSKRSFRGETLTKSSHNGADPNLSPAPLTGLNAEESTPSPLSSARSPMSDFSPRPSTPMTSLSKEPKSLNSHKVIPGSDPEDEDYNPRRNSHPKSPLPRPNRSRGFARGHGGRGSRISRSGRRGRFGRGGRGSRGRRNSSGIPLPDPEWERPDWDGTAKPARSTQTTPNARKRGSTRRDVTERVPSIETEPKNHSSADLGDMPTERETTMSAKASPAADQGRKRDSSGRALNGEGTPLRKHWLTESTSVEQAGDEHPVRLNLNGEPDGRSVKRMRNESGILIKANGEPDRRSMRAIRD